MQEMEKIKRKKIELAGAHRALEFYGLNEGIDNHITTKDWIHILYRNMLYRITYTVLYRNMLYRITYTVLCGPYYMAHGQLPI